MALPDEENPQLVGLHPNASITQAINDSSYIIREIQSISISSKDSGGDASSSNKANETAVRMATDVLKQISEPFKVVEIEKKFPFNYEESMNSVLL